MKTNYFKTGNDSSESLPVVYLESKRIKSEITKIVRNWTSGYIKVNEDKKFLIKRRKEKVVENG